MYLTASARRAFLFRSQAEQDVENRARVFLTCVPAVRAGFLVTPCCVTQCVVISRFFFFWTGTSLPSRESGSTLEIDQLITRLDSPRVTTGLDVVQSKLSTVLNRHKVNILSHG